MWSRMRIRLQSEVAGRSGRDNAISVDAYIKLWSGKCLLESLLEKYSIVDDASDVTNIDLPSGLSSDFD